MEKAPNPIVNSEKGPTKPTKPTLKDYFNQKADIPEERTSDQEDFEMAEKRGEKIIELEVSLPIKVRIPEGVFFSCRGQYYDAWGRSVNLSLKKFGINLSNRGQLDCDLRKALMESESEMINDMNEYFLLQDEISNMFKHSNSGQGYIKTKSFNIERAEQCLAQMQNIENKLRKSTEKTEDAKRMFFDKVNKPPKEEVDEYELKKIGMTREDYERMNPKQ